jgi:hypothetical protein
VLGEFFRKNVDGELSGSGPLSRKKKTYDEENN